MIARLAFLADIIGPANANIDAIALCSCGVNFEIGIALFALLVIVLRAVWNVVWIAGRFIRAQVIIGLTFRAGFVSLSFAVSNRIIAGFFIN